MAGFKSDYLANKILGQIYGGTVWTPPATLWLALYTVAPTSAGGGTEVSGNNYQRKGITNNVANFPTPTIKQVNNAALIDFGVPTGPGWGNIVFLGWWDALTAGNFLSAGPASPAVIANPGLNFQIAINGFLGTES